MLNEFILLQEYSGVFLSDAMRYSFWQYFLLCMFALSVERFCILIGVKYISNGLEHDCTRHSMEVACGSLISFAHHSLNTTCEKMFDSASKLYICFPPAQFFLLNPLNYSLQDS